MSKKHPAPQSPASPHAARHNQRKNQQRNLMPLWIGIGAIVVITAVLLLSRPSPRSANEITAAQAYEKYQAGALVVDVRTVDEWNQGHIDQSVLIPLDELPNRLSELSKDRDIVVVCHSGVRAKEGAGILLNAGFTRVSCLSGGLQAWIDAGYSIQE